VTLIIGKLLRIGMIIPERNHEGTSFLKIKKSPKHGVKEKPPTE
jgi:hypothetical protein